MNTKFLSAIAVLTAITVIGASAQDAAAQNVSKAEVEKAVDSIKADKAKFSMFCDYARLFKQSEALSQKYESDPELKVLDSQMDDIVSKASPEAKRILDADTKDELDDDSDALLHDLAKTCK